MFYMLIFSHAYMTPQQQQQQQHAYMTPSLLFHCFVGVVFVS